MIKSKSILFILHVPPPVHGSSIVGQFVRDSILINSSFDCRYINLLMSRAINDTGKSGLLKILRFLGVWFRLLFEIVNKKPDVCYLALTATGIAFYKDFLLVVLLRLFRIETVYHLHNKGIKQNQTRKINYLLYRFVFRNASVILLTKHLYNDIEIFVPISRVYICPNGCQDTAANIKPHLCQEGKPVKILFLSNLIESKGVFILLKACSILQQEGVDFECDFIGGVGNVSVEQFNEYVLNNKLRGRVKYLGAKFNEQKLLAFEEADVFAFPTYYETFGLVNLEAMQYSLPIVSTFEGGIPDIVEDGITGYLVNQKDAKALAEKLIVLIENPELREQMGKAGRKKYENEFTLDIFENRLNEILHQVVKDKL